MNFLNIFPSDSSYYLPKHQNGGYGLKGNVEDRAMDIASYIIETGATVRSAAKKFGVSKSTVHMDVTERLKKLNPSLYRDVRKVLDVNKSERHIRGGIATKEKFSKLQ